MMNLLGGGFVVDWRIQSESGERVTMKWQLEEVTMGEKNEGAGGIAQGKKVGGRREVVKQKSSSRRG